MGALKVIYDIRCLLSTIENLLFDILQAYIAVRQTFLMKMADIGRHFGFSAILDLSTLTFMPQISSATPKTL